ncbi:MAG: hypothetical protein U9R53_06825 [Chloroflexota bacterium]|nr:hypothetical protein [Chloroflexota bacterium]
MKRVHLPTKPEKQQPMTAEQQSDKHKTANFIRNVLIKGGLLFLILNFSLCLIPSGKNLGQISLYNLVFPGRARLPFGENPTEAYNLSFYDLEAMFASHEINRGPKPPEEFRIIMIGDSATWGTLLPPEDTLSGLINQDNLKTTDGRTVRAYNLAYPTMSLTKDLMILDIALTYDPNLILWPVSLESFPRKAQIETPLVANNPERAYPLIERFDLALDGQSESFVESTFWNRTLIGRRRAILDAIQLQMYGILWAATGVDQTYPDDFTPAQRDFEAGDDNFKNWSPPNLPLDQMAWEILDAGVALAGDIPVLVINEPILISKGKNSDVRYNFFYPRWAYDQYRLIMSEYAEDAPWAYIDLWDSVPSDAFTNSALHLTPDGSQLFYQTLKPTLEQMICP